MPQYICKNVVRPCRRVAPSSAGFITASASETRNVTFYLGSDDSSTLYINNNLVCNDAGPPLPSY